MRKTIPFPLLFLFVFTASFAQKKASIQPVVRLFDQPMKVNSASITVHADEFVSSTTIEIEFYNPNDKEIEGWYSFTLRPGQVVTGFQLDINGHYREGSIEERWKARNAYNTIVGKRVDPGLLSMDNLHNYNLHIYPVPARGSRKVIITIQQLLQEEPARLTYLLPLHLPDTVAHFHLEITAETGDALPFAGTGMIETKSFTRNGNNYNLKLDAESVPIRKPIQFYIPFLSAGKICTMKKGEQQLFATRMIPRVSAQYEIHPERITVFWDVSRSANKMESRKEINFLKQFVAFHKISQLTIIPFNYKLLDTFVVNAPSENTHRWTQYLEELEYDGATELGCIKLNEPTDLVMIFTDGHNTFGSRKPKLKNELTYCIHASAAPDPTVLVDIVGFNGGDVINLNDTSESEAVINAGRAKNWLMDITSANNKSILQHPLAFEPGAPLLITGTYVGNTDTLTFHYGNRHTISKTETLIVQKNEDCAQSLDKLSMLSSFDQVIQHFPAEYVVAFGKKEKVVTPNTSFIVLEKAEDYIKYKIDPPKDLQEECEQLNYVNRILPDGRRLNLKSVNGDSMMFKVADQYNSRLKLLEPLARKVYWEPGLISEREMQLSTDLNSSTQEFALTGKVAGFQITHSSAMEEVVVVGYGSVRRSAITGSISSVRTNQLPNHGTIEEALAGKVAGLNVEPIYGSPSPEPAGIRIRGASSLINALPLYVVDGIATNGNINDIVNINDIDNVTVLKGAQATALYGSRGANGVIIITTKRGKRNYYRSYSDSYRLADMEDVEYMEQIKSASPAQKESVYKNLIPVYGRQTAFYFDMAQHFYECGLRELALKILWNAPEVSGGSLQVMQAMGFVFESWGRFDEAIKMYQELLNNTPENYQYCRDLALAYYQSGDYQKSIDLLYAAIELNRDPWNLSMKTSMLTELNAIIAIHKDKLDLSAIPSSMIEPIATDLRIVLEANTDRIYDVQIKEPGGKVTSTRDRVSKNGGIVYAQSNWNDYSFCDYMLKNIHNGEYKISVDYYGYVSPSIIRIMVFRNFGKPNQSIKIENVMMDNQSGMIEIGSFRF